MKSLQGLNELVVTLRLAIIVGKYFLVKYLQFLKTKIVSTNFGQYLGFFRLTSPDKFRKGLKTVSLVSTCYKSNV